MRKSRFTDEQVVTILREADREPIGSVAKKHGISEQTIYTWRKRFGTFQADDVRRLKQLEAENALLKKLVAERDLEIEVMKEIAAKALTMPTHDCLGPHDGHGIKDARAAPVQTDEQSPVDPTQTQLTTRHALLQDVQLMA
jgi:putative transposase